MPVLRGGPNRSRVFWCAVVPVFAWAMAACTSASPPPTGDAALDAVLSGAATSAQVYDVASRSVSAKEAVDVSLQTQTDLENGAQEVEDAVATGQLDVFTGVPASVEGTIAGDGSSGEFLLALPQPKWSSVSARLEQRTASVQGPDGTWQESPELSPALIALSPGHALKLLESAGAAGSTLRFLGERTWGESVAYGYEWTSWAGRPQVNALLPGLVLDDYEVDVPVVVSLWFTSEGDMVAVERKLDLMDVLEVPFPETPEESSATVTHTTRWSSSQLPASPTSPVAP